MFPHGKLIVYVFSFQGIRIFTETPHNKNKSNDVSTFTNRLYFNHVPINMEKEIWLKEIRILSKPGVLLV